jgi:hypothetical protein
MFSTGSWSFLDLVSKLELWNQQNTQFKFFMSFRRKPESRLIGRCLEKAWIPAFAGMTVGLFI